MRNPSDKDTVVKYTISNPSNFDVKPNKIVIPGLEDKLVRIIYIPSVLNEEEAGDITFYSDDIGKWTFKAKGKGKKPTAYPPMLVHGALNKEFTGNINFKNPFKAAITVMVTLESDDPKATEAFFLLLKRKKITIKP